MEYRKSFLEQQKIRAQAKEASPERGNYAGAILGLLLGYDNPFSVGLDRLTLAQPVSKGKSCNNFTCTKACYLTELSPCI